MPRTPLYLITDYLLPQFRILIAKRLRDEGYSQSRIAHLLGVSQPAVKGYLSTSEREALDRLKEYGLSDEEINASVEELTRVITSSDLPNAMRYVTVWGLRVLSTLKLCDFHRVLDPEIPRDCDVCKYIYLKDELEELSEAVSLLSTELVTPLIPQVLSNLAYAKDNAESISDVAAFEGRITKVKGVPRPASLPSWGASVHLAKVLLKVRKRDRSVRAVMNVKYDEAVEQAVKMLNLKFVKVGPQDKADDDSIAEEIFRLYSPGTDVVFHVGGLGLEPVTYVFGRNPLDVVRKVLDIAKVYAEIKGKEQKAS